MVGIFAAVVLALVFANFQRSRAADANQALAEGIRIRQAEIVPDTAGPGAATPTFPDEASRRNRAREIFESVREDYSGTQAAGIAAVYIGEIEAAEGDLEAARAAWEAFLRDRSGDFLASEVEVNLMALDRAQGRGDELVTRLRADLSDGNSSLPGDLVLYQLALTLDSLGRSEEATSAYQRIVDEYPASAYAGVARSRTGGGPTPSFLGGA